MKGQYYEFSYGSYRGTLVDIKDGYLVIKDVMKPKVGTQEYEPLRTHDGCICINSNKVDSFWVVEKPAAK